MEEHTNAKRRGSVSGWLVAVTVVGILIAFALFVPDVHSMNPGIFAAQLLGTAAFPFAVAVAVVQFTRLRLNWNRNFIIISCLLAGILIFGARSEPEPTETSASDLGLMSGYQ